jgi:hypothetical protein
MGAIEVQLVQEVCNAAKRGVCSASLKREWDTHMHPSTGGIYELLTAQHLRTDI